MIDPKMLRDLAASIRAANEGTNELPSLMAKATEKYLTTDPELALALRTLVGQVTANNHVLLALTSLILKSELDDKTLAILDASLGSNDS